MNLFLIKFEVEVCWDVVGHAFHVGTDLVYALGSYALMELLYVWWFSSHADALR